jgi:hypothetical protein
MLELLSDVAKLLTAVIALLAALLNSRSLLKKIRTIRHCRRPFLKKSEMLGVTTLRLAEHPHIKKILFVTRCIASQCMGFFKKAFLRRSEGLRFFSEENRRFCPLWLRLHTAIVPLKLLP